MARKKIDTPEPQPWEQQEGETVTQYAAFKVYLGCKNPLDPTDKRSLPKAAERLSKSVGLLKRWSAANNWSDRADEWDKHKMREADEIAQKEWAEEIRRMRKRQAEAGKFAQIKAIKALNRTPDDEIKPSDVARLLEVGSKLERTARGDVGEVIEERQGETVTPSVVFYMPDNHRQTENEENEDDDDDAAD